MWVGIFIGFVLWLGLVLLSIKYRKDFDYGTMTFALLFLVVLSGVIGTSVEYVWRLF